MKTVRFKSVKLAPYFSLDAIATFIKTQMQFSWHEYLIFNSSHLETVFKYTTTDKYAYVFKYGCISFVNFEDYEISLFLEYISSVVSKLDLNYMYKYTENHTLKIDSNSKCHFWNHNNDIYEYCENINHIIAVVLAKSTELYWFEVELMNLLHEAESFIYFLQKGRLGKYRKTSALIMSKIIRFQFSSIESIKIFDRPIIAKQRMELRQVYDDISNYYELDDRFVTVKGKINNLIEIQRLYSSLSYKQTESRLLTFEIFLLTLFPQFHLLHYFLDKSLISLDTFFKLFK